MASDALTCRWDTCTQSFANRELLIGHVVQHIRKSNPVTICHESQIHGVESPSRESKPQDASILSKTRGKSLTPPKETSEELLNFPNLQNLYVLKEPRLEPVHDVPPELIRIILQLAAWSSAEHKYQQWNYVAVTKGDWISWGHRIYYHDIVSKFFHPSLQQIYVQLCDPSSARRSPGSRRRLATRRAAYYASLIRSFSLELRLWKLAPYGRKIESLEAKIIPLLRSLTGLEFLDLEIAMKDRLHAFAIVLEVLKLPILHLNLHYFECMAIFTDSIARNEWANLRSYITLTHLRICYDPTQRALPPGVLLNFKSITHLAVTCRGSEPPISAVTDWCTVAKILVILYASELGYYYGLRYPPPLLGQMQATFGNTILYPKILIWPEPYPDHNRKQWWAEVDGSPHSDWAEAERAVTERRG